MARIYDLVFSLGANCSAAHNLQIRKLRPFSLPFDWVYFTDESTLLYLARAVQNGFKNLMLKENLEEITPENPEWVPSHLGFLKYLDKASGYRFVNHFRRQVSEPGVYESVHATLRRRIDRLYEALEKGQNFLMVLGVRPQVSIGTLRTVREAFQSRFPNATFDLEVLQFNADENVDLTPDAGIIIHKVTRDWNAYDLEKTNFEWRFLDEVKSRTRPRRSQISFHLLPHLKVFLGWKRC